MTIQIIGLGLIGGSFAKAVKAKTDDAVIGTDQNPATLAAALAEGTIDKAAEGAAPAADMLLLALYPRAAVAFVQKYAGSIPRGCLVIDLCGVKRFVCEGIAQALRGRDVDYIGGHPMAGREVSGYGAASAGLFEGASMILTPGAGIPRERLDFCEDFFAKLGFGRVTYTTPERHDELIALTSQLAHVVSSAYAQSPAARETMGFTAGSFLDMTRVAKLNEDMWTELFLLNADYLAGQTGQLIEKLAQFQTAVAHKDAPRLKAMLREGRLTKESFET